MTENELGLEFRWQDYVLFFGKKAAQLDRLQKAYPDFRFVRARQVHGTTIHEVGRTTPDFTLQGDGLISQEERLALCSITADCVPVLMIAAGTPWFAAFHAGWRGVAARIVPLGLQELVSRDVDPHKIKIWIGPHILQASFEVQADVRDQLLASRPPDDRPADPKNWGLARLDAEPEFCLPSEKTDRFLVSLVNILLEQIAAMKVPLENVEMELRDTKTDLDFQSARREPDNTNRQISWLARRQKS